MNWWRWVLLLGLGTAGAVIYASKDDVERYIRMRQMLRWPAPRADPHRPAGRPPPRQPVPCGAAYGA